MTLIKVKSRGTDNVSGRKNLLINGAMQVAQRATSQTGLGTADGYFSLDRFMMNVGATSAGRFTMSQSTVTDLPGFANALKLQCTTADTSIAAGEQLTIDHKIEGQNLQHFAKGTSSAKAFAVSFYVKGNAAATYACELFDADNTRQITKLFNVTTSWNRIELIFPADTTGAFDDDNATSLNLIIALHSGSTYTSGTLNSTSWGSNVTANRRAGVSSFFDSTNRIFEITGVQLEVGNSVSDFEHRSFGEELSLCQRYYYRIVGNEVNNASDGGFGVATNWDNSVFFITLDFPTQMRAGPSFSYGAALSDFLILQAGATNAPTGMSINGASKQRCEMNLVKSGGFGSAGTSGWVRIVDNINGFIAFDSEL